MARGQAEAEMEYRLAVLLLNDLLEKGKIAKRTSSSSLTRKNKSSGSLQSF